MSNWISVNDELPPNASRGVHDAFPVLVLIDMPTSETTIWNVKVCTWMNNNFTGYPSGSTEVTHWMYIEELPE